MALYTDIFGRLDWLTTRVKRLCCNVDKLKTDVEAIQNSGAGSYRVYTAILNQNGGNNPQEIGSGGITAGVTYQYDELFEGSDFTNVGGPKYGDSPNTMGYFVATSDGEPISYSGTSLSYNTGAPIATVFQNTIGLIYWSYRGPGYYRLYTPGINLGAHYVTSYSYYKSGDECLYVISLDPDATNVGEADVYSRNITNGSNDDGIMSNIPIEIRIYN